jgi:rRNA-processing protein FCF1
VTRGSDDRWQAVQDKEFLKLLVADMRRIRADIEALTLNYSPLNPDQSLDAIYKLSKEMERDLDTLYKIFLEEWVEAVKAARHGAEFKGEEAADIEALRDIIKTKEMGRSTRRRTGTGRWRRTTR